MYQFSRAIYRELAPDVRPVAGKDSRQAHEDVLRACEATIERLAGDRHYFRRPARTLFQDVRAHLPMCAQERAWGVITHYLALAEAWLATQPVHGVDAAGNALECRATTRRGTPCQRMPLPHNGYCPSHQHLADTEEAEAPPLSRPLAA